MQTRFMWLSLLALLIARAGVATDDPVDPNAVRLVTAQNVALQGDTVSGVVANNSPHAVRDVQMQITYVWLWTNERHPGTDNPGRTDSYTLPGEIAAGKSQPFSYRPQSPPPTRDDGHFEPKVSVVGFTEIVPPGQ
jgi:hypothetical protein